MKVYKYKTATDGTVDLPEGAKVIHAELFGHEITLWCIIDPSERNETRKFVIVGTGQEIPNDLIHIQSFIQPPFVWHIFEKSWQ